MTIHDLLLVDIIRSFSRRNDFVPTLFQQSINNLEINQKYGVRLLTLSKAHAMKWKCFHNITICNWPEFPIALQSKCDLQINANIIISPRIVLTLVWSIIYKFIWILWYWKRKYFYILFFSLFSLPVGMFNSIFYHFPFWKWIFLFDEGLWNMLSSQDKSQ